MEEIPICKRRKIEETVRNILKNSDLETATEFSVRAAAAQQLSIDLSDLPHKCLVRQVLESFLLSTPPLDDDTTTTNKETQFLLRDDHHQLLSKNTGRVICKLSDKRNVAVHDFNGKALVSIRDYYEKDGKQFPSGRGISLTAKQWSLFRNSFPAIEETIAKMEAQIRLAIVEKQSGADMSLSVGDIATQGILAFDQNQTGTNISSSEDAVDPLRHVGEGKFVGMDTNDSVTALNGRQSPQAELLPANSVGLMDSQRQQKRERGPDVNHRMTIPSSQGQTENQRHQPQADKSTLSAFVPQGDIPHNWASNFPRSLIPIMTGRLDGKNYHSWVHQMKFFLNQLNVGYVLKNPCPSISVESMSLEEIINTKAAARKWVDDEYICRHYILNSLCDTLFNQYCKKDCSAKELWEELKSVYDEDVGTVRSQVSKYIDFQMVDGISVLEQAEELQRILNTIMASGIWVDENFHVSVIISKLPPSWKDYRAKLMHDVVLPYNVLMHRLKLEEESRNQCMKESLARNCQVQNSKVKSNSGVKKKDMKGVCYTCGKEGHMSKHCPDRKMEIHGKSNGKENETVQPIDDV